MTKLIHKRKSFNPKTFSQSKNVWNYLKLCIQIQKWHSLIWLGIDYRAARAAKNEQLRRWEITQLNNRKGGVPVAVKINEASLNQIKYPESWRSWLQYAIDDFSSQEVGSWDFKGNLWIVSRNFLMRGAAPSLIYLARGHQVKDGFNFAQNLIWSNFEIGSLFNNDASLQLVENGNFFY